MVLTFYFDLRSQPCRSLYLFLKGTGVDFKPVLTDLMKGEHLHPEFVKKNPFHTVPMIDDDGFVLTESSAIMLYIAVKYNVAEHWFPRKDVKKQAGVEQFLHWQHLSIRRPVVSVFQGIIRNRVSMGPSFPKQPINEELVNKSKEDVRQAVKHIAEYFLQDKPYIAGKEISAADIVGVCELMQLDGALEEKIYTSNKKVNDWVQRVRDDLQPHFDVAFEDFKALRDMFTAMNVTS